MTEVSQAVSSQQDTANGKRGLKVLMIVPTSFFSDYGGHIRIFEESLALRYLGHHVTIVTYQQGRDLPDFDIRRTAKLPYRTDYEVGSSRHKIAFDALLAWKALRVAQQIRPDVIHAHMHEGALIGAVIARLLNIPLVFDFQGSLTAEMIDHGFLDPQGRIYPKLHNIEKRICHAAPIILTSSSRAKRLLMREFRVPQKRIVPLPDCVDLSRFDPNRYIDKEKADLREHLGIPKGRIVVTYLGLLADYQGTDHLIQAAQILKVKRKEVHFLIMGYPNVEKYQAISAAFGVTDRVTFTGKIPYEFAPLYLSLGDISVSAKMSATEGSGKVLNYMAMGQPIVAYDSQVHREYLGEWGIYAPSGDVEAFAAAIGNLIDQPEWRREIGQNLQQRAEQQFSWSNAALRIVSVYEQLILAGEQH